MPPSYPSTNANTQKFASTLDQNKKEMIDAIDTQVVDQHNSEFDGLDDVLDVFSLARTSIDESHLPTSDQEIFEDACYSSTEDMEADTEYE